MKIVEASAGALTNFEVLDLLRSRGAGKDPTRAIASISTSEFQVYDYLEKTVACDQTRDVIHKFVDECKKFDLAKAEILNIVNMRPTSEVELCPIFDEIDLEQRLGDTAEELVETIVQVLPPNPYQKEESNEETAEEEETENPEPETAKGEEETENPEPETANKGEEETENPEPNTP